MQISCSYRQAIDIYRHFSTCIIDQVQLRYIPTIKNRPEEARMCTRQIWECGMLHSDRQPLKLSIFDFKFNNDNDVLSDVLKHD